MNETDVVKFVWLEAWVQGRISHCAQCCELFTRSPALARDGRLCWLSRKTVLPLGIGLAAVLGVGQLSWLVKLIVHWLTAYCPSTLYCAMLTVINNACLLSTHVWHEPYVRPKIQVFEIQFGPNRISVVWGDLEALNRELTVLCVNLSSEFWLAFCYLHCNTLNLKGIIFGRPYYRSSLWHAMSSVCLSVCLSVTFCIVAKRWS